MLARVDDTSRRRPIATAIATLAGLLAVLIGGLPPMFADAQESTFDATSLGLEVVAGFDGQATRNSFMPVTVHLEPTRLFSGTVEIATSSGAIESRAVEVAGGAAKEFVFVVPSGSIRVRVRPDGSDQAVQVRPDVNGNPAGVLVGVALGDASLPAGVPNTTLQGTEDRAFWVAVDAALLERSALVVSSLGTLVLSADELEQLSDDGIRNLQLAVTDGLNLVLVLPAGTAPTTLPWQPVTSVAAGTAQRPATVVAAADAWVLDSAQAGIDADDTAVAVAASVPAGRGRVVMTGLAPDTGEGARASVWSQLLAQRDATGQLDGEFTSQRGWLVSQALSGGGSLDLPALGLLAGFALLYVLVAGPGNALLLRRLGRNELGWITLPAITIVFLVGAFLTASGTQPKVGLAGGVRSWVDGVGSEVAIAAIRAPSQGTHTIELPGDGWHLEGTADVNGIQVAIDRSSGNVRASLNLQALQVGTVLGERTIADPPPFDVDVVASDGSVEVTVTNTSGAALQNLQLRAAGARVALGDLAAGATVVHTLDLGRLAQLPVYEDAFGELRLPDGRVEAPGSFRALLRGDLLADRPGQVVVVADRPTTDTEIFADNRPTEVVGEVLAVAVTVSEAGNVVPGHVDRALLVGAFQQGWQPSAHAVEGQLTAYLRFRLPASAAGRVLSLTPDLGRGEGMVEGGLGLGVPEIRPLPMPPAPGQCLEIIDTAPDGSTAGSQDCDGGDHDIPGCPEDALTCEFSTDGWFFTFDDGRTQRGTFSNNGENVDQPMVQGQGQGQVSDAIEVLDQVTGQWHLLRDVVAADGTITTDHLSAFGEVLVRVSGGLFPFDYSARGMGATIQGASA